MAKRKKITKKAPAKKSKARPAAQKKAAPVKKKAAVPKESPAKTRASAAAPPKQVIPAKPTPKPAAPAPAPAGTIGAEEVMLGHLMALRPRIHVGFKPSAFADAKRALEDARYATIEQAARAVAEKAIEISNDSARQDPFRR